MVVIASLPLFRRRSPRKDARQICVAAATWELSHTPMSPECGYSLSLLNKGDTCSRANMLQSREIKSNHSCNLCCLLAYPPVSQPTSKKNNLQSRSPKERISSKKEGWLHKKDKPVQGYFMISIIQSTNIFHQLYNSRELSGSLIFYYSILSFDFFLTHFSLEKSTYSLRRLIG